MDKEFQMIRTKLYSSIKVIQAFRCLKVEPHKVVRTSTQHCTTTGYNAVFPQASKKENMEMDSLGDEQSRQVRCTSDGYSAFIKATRN